MNEIRVTTIDSQEAALAGKSAMRPSLAVRLTRRLLFNKLSSIQSGHLRITDPYGTAEFGTGSPKETLSAHLRIEDPLVYTKAVMKGSIGVAEAFIEGAWTCSDLTALMRIIAQNQQINESLEQGFGRIWQPVFRLTHRLRRNTRAGSRKNIHEHYDLGNDFFSQFLDDSMMYSSAYFPSESMSLEQASEAKLELVCRQLDLKEGEHLVEIGSGWGGFAVHAASRYGVRVTTTTISEEQHKMARKRVQEAGLSDRVSVVMKDYRDLGGTYDKLVSIEMIEAVGHDFLDTYFAKCRDLLKLDGLGLIQAITIADEFYEEAKRSVDFIQHFIFPGSAIPSLTSLAESINRVGGLSITGTHDLTSDYALTLQAWRERFFQNLEEIRRLGFSDQFIRMWHFYFCYCEGGFRERHIGDYQLLLKRI